MIYGCQKGIVMHATKIESLFCLKKTSVLTVFVFALSLFQPVIQLMAFESDFYDGPGGYMQTEVREGWMDRNIDRFGRIQNESMARANKVVGLALGGAVGGGLVLALGLAASPILAATTVIGSVLAGGFVGDQFGNQTRGAVDRATSSSNFMSWAGGLAGGALGFMMFPGASIIGAALGAGLGGMAGNAISDNKYRIASLPSRLLNGGMGRLGGGFMGPSGFLLENPLMRSRLLSSQTGMGVMPGWYGQDGMFRAGMDPRMARLMMEGLPDWRRDYVWHDNNGDLAYPGWEKDLYRLDNNSAVHRTLPEWTTGNTGFNYSGTSIDSYYDSGTVRGSLQNPDWGTEVSSGENVRIPATRTYDSPLTSDGETFDSGYSAGTEDSLIGLTARYHDAVTELRQLTEQNAPALRRKKAHQEVQRLEALLQHRLR